MLFLLSIRGVKTERSIEMDAVEIADVLLIVLDDDEISSICEAHDNGSFTEIIMPILLKHDKEVNPRIYSGD